MSKDSEQEERELRKEILKQGKVRKPIVTISQKFYPNNRALSLEMKSQELVEIGIDDLMRLILQDRERYALSKQIEALQQLLDGEHGNTCICQQADTKVCDHNWSLCNEVRRVIEVKQAQLSKLMNEASK